MGNLPANEQHPFYKAARVNSTYDLAVVYTTHEDSGCKTKPRYEKTGLFASS